MNQQKRSIEETILMKRPPDVAWKPPVRELIPGTDFRIGPTIYSGSRIVCRGIDEKCSDPEKKSLILIFRKDVVERGCSDSRFVIDLTKIDLKKYGADHWPYPYVELIRRNSVVQLTVTPDAGDGVFKIVDFLGMGGFGEVWEAEALDQTDGVIPARRAIKFLEPWESKNSNRLEAEGNSALSRLQKLRGMEQFTIGFYGDFILPDKAQNPGWPSCGIVMELAGATLEDVVQYYLSDNTGKVRLQQPTMLHLCGQLIDAVSSLHRLGYVHCDLKERNVLLVFPSCKWRDPAAPGGTDPLLKARVVLGDFDTLTPIGETHRKILQQTLEGHRAPELMQTAGANSRPIRLEGTKAWPAEDCFALGVILERLKQCTAGNQESLEGVAERLQARDPGARPKLGSALKLALSPSLSALHSLLRDAGWRNDDPCYERFHGREWLREKFEKFCRQQKDRQQGGLFLLTADAGLGKTALMTHWNSLPRLGTRDASTERDRPEDRRTFLCPAFYFHYGGNNRTVEAMVCGIAEQLRLPQYRLQAKDGDSEKVIGVARFSELLRNAAAGLPPGEVLTLLIDGVDEAESPQTVVQFLRELCSFESNRGLPSRVFLVVASRPRDSQMQPLLSQLSNLGSFVSSVELRADGAENAADAGEFWQSECRLLLPEDVVEEACSLTDRAVEVSGGLLLVLRSVIDDMKDDDAEAARRKLQRFLQEQPCQTLNDWYFGQWKRLLDAFAGSNEAQRKLEQLARLMSAIREPVPEFLLAAWMSGDQQQTSADLAELRKLLQSMKWLLREICPEHCDGSVAAWYPRHASALDFLNSEQGPSSGLRTAIHMDISNAILQYDPRKDPDRHKDPERQVDWACRDFEYEVRHIIAHLLEASRAKNGRHHYRTALDLLTNQKYLDVRVNLGR